MTAEMILQKGQSGEMLSANEMTALMLHAIDLLKFIENETRASIERANALLESQYKKAA